MSKLCVSKLCVSKLCVRRRAAGGRGGGGGGVDGGRQECTTKNKNPTQRCGKKSYSVTLRQLPPRLVRVLLVCWCAAKLSSCDCCFLCCACAAAWWWYMVVEVLTMRNCGPGKKDVMMRWCCSCQPSFCLCVVFALFVSFVAS